MTFFSLLKGDFSMIYTRDTIPMYIRLILFLFGRRVGTCPYSTLRGHDDSHNKMVIYQLGKLTYIKKDTRCNDDY